MRSSGHCQEYLHHNAYTFVPAEYSQQKSQTEKVPQRTFATKISPNFRVNFLVRFASKPLFYWVVPSNCSDNSLVLFVRFFGFGVLFRLLKKAVRQSLGIRLEDPDPLLPEIFRSERSEPTSLASGQCRNPRFSLRSCRSSSVIFFDLLQGNLAGLLRDFFSPTE